MIIITQETLEEEENSPEVSDLIDINHANKEELCQLTGIGEVLAQRTPACFCIDKNGCCLIYVIWIGLTHKILMNQ